MMLVPARRHERCKSDAGIELISIPVSRVLHFQHPTNHVVKFFGHSE